MKKTKKGKKEKLPRVLTEVEHQLGKTLKRWDKKLKALKPGKRKSEEGNVYYEYRKNRSDLKDDI